MVHHCLWKMFATPGAGIKPGLVRRPLCHKVNLPRCEARRRHLIMTCDIFGTGQTNTLTLCYLLGKTYKPLSSHWNQQALPNYWKIYWREPHTHSIEGSWWLDALNNNIGNYPKKCFWRRKKNTGVTVVCVSPWYVYSHTHMPGDMCIPGGDTINTDTHPRHNKERSSLSTGNVVDII